MNRVWPFLLVDNVRDNRSVLQHPCIDEEARVIVILQGLLYVRCRIWGLALAVIAFVDLEDSPDPAGASILYSVWQLCCRLLREELLAHLPCNHVLRSVVPVLGRRALGAAVLPLALGRGSR